jgi:hypothetical protein
MKQLSRIITLLILLGGIAIPSIGQDTLRQEFGDTGLIRIFKDTRIDLLIDKQVEVNEYTTRSGRRLTIGFRILVINTKDRQEALNAKSLIYQKFPDIKPYLWHQAPYYKLKAGNFRTKEDAELYAKKLRPFFPKGIFVMTDDIDTYFANTGAEPNQKQK